MFAREPSRFHDQQAGHPARLLRDAARRLEGVPGCIFELGLGSGRTFDHLRQLFPDREIFASTGPFPRIRIHSGRRSHDPG
jgi:hypothetical protein